MWKERPNKLVSQNITHTHTQSESQWISVKNTKNSKWIMWFSLWKEYWEMLWQFNTEAKMKYYQNKMFNTLSVSVVVAVEFKYLQNALHMSGNISHSSYLDVPGCSSLIHCFCFAWLYRGQNPNETKTDESTTAMSAFGVEEVCCSFRLYWHRKCVYVLLDGAYFRCMRERILFFF